MEDSKEFRVVVDQSTLIMREMDGCRLMATLALDTDIERRRVIDLFMALVEAQICAMLRKQEGG